MNEGMIKYIFVLFSIIHACLVVGLTLYIFYYYFPTKKTHLKNRLRWHVVVISGSYICLTLATLKTAILGFYGWGDLWYWAVTLAYISGFISLIFVFKYAAKKDKHGDETTKI